MALNRRRIYLPTQSQSTAHASPQAQMTAPPFTGTSGAVTPRQPVITPTVIPNLPVAPVQRMPPQAVTGL